MKNCFCWKDILTFKKKGIDSNHPDGLGKGSIDLEEGVKAVTWKQKAWKYISKWILKYQ